MLGGLMLLLGCPHGGPAQPPAPGADVAMMVELELAQGELRQSRELKIEARIRNRSDAPIQLYTWPLSAPSLVLDLREVGGAPVPTAPPPTPIADDGQSHREVVAPGEALVQTWRGAQLFGWALDPGEYEIRFRYQAVGQGADYTGELASGWQRFTILP